MAESQDSPSLQNKTVNTTSPEHKRGNPNLNKSINNLNLSFYEISTPTSHPPTPKPNSLTCFFTNATSINSRKKLDNLLAQLAILNNPQLVLICETWFTSDSIKEIAGYAIYSKERPDPEGDKSLTGHGGVAIYVRNDLNSFEVSSITTEAHIEACWCEVRTSKEKILIGCLYRPPDKSREESLALNNLIDKACKAFDSKKYTGILLAGDFNHPSLKWDSEGAINPTNHFRKANDFTYTINSNYLSQHVLDPTFGANILDLILTKEPSRISAINVGPPINASNKGKLHSTLNWEFHLKDKPKKDNKRSTILNINKSDFVSMNVFFSNVKWNVEFEGLDCSSMYQKFTDIYNIAIDRFTPTIQVIPGQRPSKPKWMNRELVKLAHLKNSLWYKHLSASSPTKEQLLVMYKETCKQLNKRKSIIIKDFELDLALKSKTNTKALYSYIKNQTKVHDNIRSLTDKAGRSITDQMEITNCLNSQFSSVFSEPCLPTDHPAMDKLSQTSFSLPISSLGSKEVEDELRKLDTSKATGGDGIHPRILKECAGPLAQVLSLIFIKSFSSSSVPAAWKNANIVPIFKKGKKNRTRKLQADFSNSPTM